MGRLLLVVAYLALAAVITVVGAAVWGYAEFTRPGPLTSPRVVVIPTGSGLERISNTLVSNGVIQHAEVFALGAKFSGEARNLKAGEYRFPSGASPRDVMAILKSGKTEIRRLTLPEGLSVSMVLEKLRASEGLMGEISTLPEEGSLLPETYHYSYGDERDALLARMTDGMSELLAELWLTRAPNLPLKTARDALILASVIERETGIDEERGIIAGVFINRLRRGMRLQSDPTVAYGIAPQGLGRALTRADLGTQHPYNTYIIKGLPAGPICNPGASSIRAALNPTKTDFLYFVADGTGGHAFAKTLKEHNRNVAKWRRFKRNQSR
jgi:UPF0755 protein